MMGLTIEHLAMTYSGLAAPVLSIDRLRLAAGERVAITGPSGSGKSTLVNLVTGLERLSSGRIVWGGVDIAGLSETSRDRWRGANIGLVMQDFHLFDGLTALDNVLLPVRLARAADAAVTARAQELLARVGLVRPEQRVETMSRGEMQRVAVARAALRKPGILIADEPTASLDPEAGAQVAELLLDLARAEGATLMVVSHDARLTERLERRIGLEAGRIVSDSAETLI
jgi:putative ABC transport system ATP-binding protein